jgi:eukaryotic-like serine/threonine-protein kinase
MEGNPKTGPGIGPPAAAVRTPSEAGSSSSDANLGPDAPTLAPYSPDSPDAPTLLDGSLDSAVAPAKEFVTPGPVFFAHSDPTTLPAGMLLAQRYQIVQILGQGGMGAVYKATDLELNRTVALKVIRPELARDKAIVDRFKQELLLAHQVTHRNVIRIYDLSEAEGMKFITMEYVEGENLLTLIRQKQRFTPDESVEIMQQVCRALEAAHSVGVIHRDLKPQNVMRDKTGRVVVMDFGLARTLEGEGMTQSGALVGTMEYMSPEQALGKPLDQRSDIFALGLIFYEMLTGQMPFKANSAVASLLRRTQEQVAPVSDHDNTIPRSVSNIVSKCLERNLELRYQTTTELLRDLETWEGKRAAATLSFHAKVGPWGQSLPWPTITAIVTVVALAITGWVFRARLFAPASHQKVAVGPQVSLAILPFRNASGDATLDWLGPSLAEMLSTDVGQSSRLRTVSQERLHQLLSDLRVAPNTSLEPTALRRLAEFSNADTLVWGQYARFGNQIRIDATLQDIKHDRAVPLKIEVPSEKDVPGAVDRLAESIRQTLALPQDVVKELRASSFQPTSKSIEALRDYNQGIESQRDGKNLEAQKQLQAATQEDPSFGLAYAKLAQTYSSLGYDAEAEQSAKKAVDLGHDLPEAEKYLISAIELQVLKNYPDAIKAYLNLAKVAPDNSDVQSALAGLYQDSGDLAKAKDYYQKILQSNPKDIGAILDLGRISLKSGDPQSSFDPLNRAYSLAVQVDNQEQKAISLHLMAVAYRMLSKPQEVLRNEHEAIAIWRQIDQKRGLAFSLNELANSEASLGNNKDARKDFEEALQIRRDIGDKRGLGDSLLDVGSFEDDQGNHDQALKMYKEALDLQRDLGNEGMQALCLNNIGSVYSNEGRYEDALTYFQQALQLREKAGVPQDIVEAVHNLGYTVGQMGQYDKAISYYLRALELRRNMNDPRGAAIESYSLGILFIYQGRFGAAINSEQEALKTFRDIQDKTSWMAQVLDGHAEALILAGRADEAKSDLDEALSLSRELKNNETIAATLGFQGDAKFYSGDLKSARPFYEEALRIAMQSKEPDSVLLAKADLAKVQVAERHATEAIASLRQLVQQADELGEKYTSVECSILMAEGMLQNHDRSHGRQELQRALQLADKLGMQPLSARAHYVLAAIDQSEGNTSDAQSQYREVIRLMDTMKKDPGAEKLLQRSDFKTMYDDSTRATQATKS